MHIIRSGLLFFEKINKIIFLLTSGGSYDTMKMWMGLAPKNKRIPAIYHLCVDRFAYAECCAGITVSDASKYLSRGSLLSMEEKK